MTTDTILSTIDEEIRTLQQVRALLTGNPSAPIKKKAGRPKGSRSAAAVKVARKRVMSDEARSKIAAAQKKRWAAAKTVK